MVLNASIEHNPLGIKLRWTSMCVPVTFVHVKHL